MAVDQSDGCNADVTCVFCASDGGVVLWRDNTLRVVAADEPDYPGFCRVIWHTHVAELTDLDTAACGHLMQTVSMVERAIRDLMRPDKMNLASLGNQVPHLHWHIIPRYHDDAHFPSPVWAVRRRNADAARLAARRAQASALRGAIAAALEHFQ